MKPAGPNAQLLAYMADLEVDRLRRAGQFLRHEVWQTLKRVRLLGADVPPKGPSMGKHVEIENIEEMRRRVGIDDVELREAIRGLRIGDFVKLTFLTGGPSSVGEPRLVRVTRISGSRFQGRLVDRRASAGLSGLRVGSRLAFTADHIHSLPNRRPPHAP